MKSATIGICVVAVLCLGSSLKAQCGCGMQYPSPVVPMVGHYPPPAPPMARVLPAPSRNMPANVAYVNRLATPVPRANYTLNYAIHLTDGRILLSDFLPPGHVARGVESQSGAGGRRLTANSSRGQIAIVDPASNATVTTIGNVQ